MTATQLSTHPVHLGLGATAEKEPAFTGEMEWYAGYIERHAKDGADARLMAMHDFSTSWDVWEMHPKGEEVVLCTAGRIVLIQEVDGKEVRTELLPGEYAINPRGVWHTADVECHATCIFVTAGEGTEHRPR